MDIYRSQGAPMESIADGKGETTIWNPMGAIMVVRNRGHISLSHGEAQIRIADAILARGSLLDYFQDAELVTTYESAYRRFVTEWTDQHRDRIHSSQILMNSPLLVMGFTVANIILRDVVKLYSNRKAFEARLTAYTHEERRR